MTGILIKKRGQEWFDSLYRDMGKPISDKMTYWRNLKAKLQHRIGDCGAIVLETKNGGYCADCHKLISK